MVRLILSMPCLHSGEGVLRSLYSKKSFICFHSLPSLLIDPVFRNVIGDRYRKVEWCRPPEESGMGRLLSGYHCLNSQVTVLRANSPLPCCCTSFAAAECLRQVTQCPRNLAKNQKSLCAFVSHVRIFAVARTGGCLVHR